MQTTLFKKTSATHERNNIKKDSFLYKKRQLRMWYKLWKSQIISANEIPSKFRGLLVRYYGVPASIWDDEK